MQTDTNKERLDSCLQLVGKLMVKITCLVILIAVIGCQQMSRNAYVNTHVLDDSTKVNILAGNINFGMTEEQVFASWGGPWNVVTSVGRWGEVSEWTYGAVGSPITYLYFENGVLTSWQTSY